jgi:hypothetical protein
MISAMQVEEIPQLSKEELLQTRDIALTPKTGAKAGIMRNPSTTYALYVPPTSPLYTLPTLAKIMVLQTWKAHPSLRNSTMILDPLDWDNMPEPLIKEKVFKSSSIFD